MTKKTTEKKAAPRSREPSRLNPREAIDALVNGVTGIIEQDQGTLANALLAYSVAAISKHPYAGQILTQVIERYAEAGGITLDKTVGYEPLEHHALLQGFGEYMRAKHLEQREGNESPPGYSAQTEQTYGNRR